MKLSLTAALKSKTAPAGRYSDGRNLYLNISKTGAKSWAFCWLPVRGHAADKGYQREIGLGSATGAGSTDYLTLEQARLAADRIRVQIADGIDPIAARKQAKLGLSSVDTFEALLQDVIDIEKALWKAEADGSYANEGEWKRSLAKYAASLSSLPIYRVGKDQVLDVLRPIWTTIPVTADRIRYRIKAVIDLAIERGKYAGRNPAEKAAVESAPGFGKQAKAKVEDAHTQLHYDEIPALMAKLAACKGSAAKGLAFTILTAVRTDEAREARWSEIDFDKAEWTIPAARMKAGVAHIVPLSTAALAVLASLPRIVGNDFIFAGKKDGTCVNATAFSDKLCDPAKKGGLGYFGKATVHGMRKSFRNWIGDKLTGYTEQEFEFCLAHKLDAVEGAYRTMTAVEKRRAIMQSWANYCEGKTGENIVRIAA